MSVILLSYFINKYKKKKKLVKDLSLWLEQRKNMNIKSCPTEDCEAKHNNKFVEKKRTMKMKWFIDWVVVDLLRNRIRLHYEKASIVGSLLRSKFTFSNMQIWKKKKTNSILIKKFEFNIEIFFWFLINEFEMFVLFLNILINLIFIC